MQEMKHLQREKECSMCHQFKPRDQFYKDRERKDGLTHRCRDCHKLAAKKYHERWKLERSRGLIEVPEEKRCKRCHQVKPVSMFWVCNNRRDGLDHFCIDCKIETHNKMLKKWKQTREKNKTTVKNKKCKKCKKILQVSKFNKSINFKDGFDSICKNCWTMLIQDYKNKWAKERANNPIMINGKKCSLCNQVLPVSSFYPDDYNKDGYRPYCIECELKKAELNTIRWEEERLKSTEVKKEKTCNICNRRLPISQFHKSRKYKDGYWSTCISCNKNRLADYVVKWEEHRDKNNEVLVAKECNVCKQILPVSSFSMNKKTKDGLVAICKNCIEKKHQEYMNNWRDTQNKKSIDFSKSEGVFPSFEKKCARCNKILPVTFFHHDKRKKDGYSSSCKDCKYEIGKASRMRVKKNAKRIIPSEKLCKKCNRLLPSEEFGKDIHHSDGLTSYCKECNRRREREYRHRQNVKEKK
ncbi:hypothetical protein AYK24_08440 [Thermoplasmatales archaeon SG8-52-4]|nr:MAG: hypothetical protein AYK24_08440 [Thermoplasmatales archaeon SG8-52-4]